MSLINNEPYEQSKHVKFISYSGKYPNLCRGTLKLEIDGVEYCFCGDNDGANGKSENGAYKRFWHTFGEYYGDTNPFWSGEWVIDVSTLPEHLRKYAAEIDEVFNKNVERGCCGGCK